MRNLRSIVTIFLVVVIGLVLIGSRGTNLATASGLAGFDSPAQVSSSTSTFTTTITSTSTSTSFTSTTLTSSTSTTFTFPSLALNPNFGSVGLTVQVTGSGYSMSDSSCSLSGTVVVSPNCSVSGGALSGSFIVANIGFGSYTVTATGNQIGDSASATFNVNTAAPAITFSPTSASPTQIVHVTGTNFLSTDTSCSLSGSPVTGSTCSIAGGTLNGAFTVANVGSGFYTVTATANPGQDSASANFQVNSAIPSITINPSNAGVGASIQVSGSGFSSSDSSCALSGGAAVASETCSINNGAVSASFVVANAPQATYTITVTGNPTGDMASASFSLTSSPTTVSLNPPGGTPGNTIQVSGVGFSIVDTSCSISGGAVTASTCTISGGTLTGSFVVANVATGNYGVTATGSTGDSASATLAVGPSTAPAVPGFPVEAIILGFLVGLASVVLLRRKTAG